MTDGLHIVQLYPGELGVTGDRGNVRALQLRLQRADVAVRVTHVGRGQALPDDIDILVVGNGPLSALRGVYDDAMSRAERVEAAVAEGVPVLAIGGGAELLGHGVDVLEGENVPGLGVFDIHVARTHTRRVGYVCAQTDHGTLMGFEDHASEWTLGDGVTGYGRITAGQGSWTRDGVRGEGVTRNNAYALNVQGPVLPLNPALTDAILTVAAARRGIPYTTGERHRPLDDLAEGARSAIRGLVAHDKHFTSMDLA